MLENRCNPLPLQVIYSCGVVSVQTSVCFRFDPLSYLKQRASGFRLHEIEFGRRIASANTSCVAFASPIESAAIPRPS